MAVINRDGVLYYKFVSNNKQIFKVCKWDGVAITAGSTTKEQARNWKRAEQVEAEARLEIAKQSAAQEQRKRLGLVEDHEVPQPKKVLTLEEFIATWWADYGNAKYADQAVSRRGYEFCINALLREHEDTLPMPPNPVFCLKDMLVTAIDINVISRYLSIRHAQGKKGRTIQYERTTLLMLLRYAQLTYHMAVPTTRMLPNFKSAKHEFCLTAADEKLYLAAASARNQYLWLWALIQMDTSMEPGPTAALQWSDVHFDDLKVYRLGWIFDRCGKNAYRQRKVGMSTRLAAALRARWEERRKPRFGFVFPRQEDESQSMALSSFQTAHGRLWGKHIKEQVTAINAPLQGAIPYFRPYDLRHTAATRLKASGAAGEGIQRALGHASMRMTEHYIHEGDATKEAGKAEAFQMLDEMLLRRDEETGT